jgi:quinol monooxygenase YgiN
MILVIGDVTLRAGTLDEALAESRIHVDRSRTEPGCISHDVHVDTEIPNRIVFVERWLDDAALKTHFKVPESIEFARTLSRLAAERPVADIYAVADPSEDS